MSIQVSESADDCRIVPHGAVPIEFDEVVHPALNVVTGQGPLGVARREHFLPRRELRVDRPLFLVAALDQGLDLVGEVNVC